MIHKGYSNLEVSTITKCFFVKLRTTRYYMCIPEFCEIWFKIVNQKDNFVDVIRFNNNISQVTGARMTAQDVNAQSMYFPPCMGHLYNVLQSRHRLTHEARRQFTLFLKDAGMPIEEALNFWSTEYSKPSSECGSGCTHSWQKDAHRYRYSIRHMYGLEGGRYTYSVPSCNYIQVIQSLLLNICTIS
jgi:DNA primase large subunit